MQNITLRLFNNPDIGSYFHRPAVNAKDDSSTSLPSNLTNYSPDGVKIADRSRILFTNLSDSSKNNRIYEVELINGQLSLKISSSLRDARGNSLEGDTVFVKSGNSFNCTLWTFDKGEWKELDVDEDRKNDGALADPITGEVCIASGNDGMGNAGDIKFQIDGTTALRLVEATPSFPGFGDYALVGETDKSWAIGSSDDLSADFKRPAFAFVSNTVQVGSSALFPIIDGIVGGAPLTGFVYAGEGARSISAFGSNFAGAPASISFLESAVEGFFGFQVHDGYSGQSSYLNENKRDIEVGWRNALDTNPFDQINWIFQKNGALRAHTSSSDLVFTSDNTCDIGSLDDGSTLERPRRIYAGTELIAGDSVSSDGSISLNSSAYNTKLSVGGTAAEFQVHVNPGVTNSYTYPILAAGDGSTNKDNVFYLLGTGVDFSGAWEGMSIGRTIEGAPGNEDTYFIGLGAGGGATRKQLQISYGDYGYDGGLFFREANAVELDNILKGRDGDPGVGPLPGPVVDGTDGQDIEVRAGSGGQNKVGGNLTLGGGYGGNGADGSVHLETVLRTPDVETPGTAKDLRFIAGSTTSGGSPGTGQNIEFTPGEGASNPNHGRFRIYYPGTTLTQLDIIGLDNNDTIIEVNGSLYIESEDFTAIVPKATSSASGERLQLESQSTSFPGGIGGELNITGGSGPTGGEITIKGGPGDIGGTVAGNVRIFSGLGNTVPDGNIICDSLDGYFEVAPNATTKLRINTTGIGYFGVTPVAQQGTISDPAGGATIDVEARAAIDDILDLLQSYGLMS